MNNEPSGRAGDREPFESLQLPSMAPASLLRQFGPGMILMMTGIGTSHLVTAPVAGGRFGYALLWCIPIAYIFKYYGFEMAFRFTHATGRSILDAYSTAWKKLPVWYVLITTVIQSAIGQAGRLVASAAVAFYFFRQYLGWDIPGLADDYELSLYGLLLGVISVAIILGGKYAAVELVTKIAAGILIVCSLGVYVVNPAPVSEFVHFFQLDTPEGSWLIIASFLGLLPTGIDVSLQASEWGKAKKAGMGRIRDELEAQGITSRFDAFTSVKGDLAVDTSKLPAHAKEYCRRWFKIGLWDFRAGHLISFILVCIFMLLAAVWLFPSEVQGNAVMGEIARMFTDSVGPGMMIVFLVGAMAATYSTAFNYFDGWPRVVGACCRNLFPATAELRGTAREDLGPEQPLVLRIQHLPHQHGVFAGNVSGDHRRPAATGFPGAGRLRAGVLRRAGDLLSESLLLLHRHSQGRQDLLSVQIRDMVWLDQPDRIHRNVVGADLAATGAASGRGIRRVGPWRYRPAMNSGCRSSVASRRRDPWCVRRSAR